jgi:mannose-6-phosphate isomerase-like protein (cupin superfamily)
MPLIIRTPCIIKAAGNKPKTIEEFVGQMNTKDLGVSIARMKSPAGWVEPGQTPEFTEYTIVLSGTVQVNSKNETFDVHAGEAIIVRSGEWVQYSSPEAGGAEYIAVCIPAFTASSVHRDT